MSSRNTKALLSAEAAAVRSVAREARGERPPIIIRADSSLLESTIPARSSARIRYCTSSCASVSPESNVSQEAPIPRCCNPRNVCSMRVVLPLPAGATMRVARDSLEISSSMSPWRRIDAAEMPGGVSFDCSSVAGIAAIGTSGRQEVLDDGSPGHDESQALRRLCEHRDVTCRVAVHDQNVGTSAWPDTSDLTLHAKERSIDRGRGAQDLDDRKYCRAQPKFLVLPLAEVSGQIRSETELDAMPSTDLQRSVHFPGYPLEFLEIRRFEPHRERRGAMPCRPPPRSAPRKRRLQQ